MSSGYHVAIAGATGAVGTEFLRVLEKHRFPIASLRLLASERSEGKKLTFAGETFTVQRLTENSFDGVQIAFFSAGASRSRQFAPAAVRAGAVVIDNSSAFRMDPQVPLVVPEINLEDAREHKGIIANPNCSTIIMLMAVAPLHRLSRVRRIVVSTYQSASGAGAQAMQELLDQTAAVLEGKEVTPRVLPHQIAFNLFSHNSAINEWGYNEEEWKMIHESRKILHEPEMAITATCVRVPVLRALEIVAETAGNVVIANAVNEARASVREGQKISAPLAASGLFPQMVTQMIDIGEETGRMSDMLIKVANFYDTEVDVAVKALTSLIEPALIIFLGGIVGFIVSSIMVPMFTMINALNQ